MRFMEQKLFPPEVTYTFILLGVRQKRRHSSVRFHSLQTCCSCCPSSVSGHVEVQRVDGGCRRVAVIGQSGDCFLRKFLQQHNWRISVCRGDNEPTVQPTEREGR